MIAKMKSNVSLGDTITYNLKEDSHIIDTHNLTGENVTLWQKQMLATQDLFEGRAKNLTAHIILSPSIEDGNKQTPESWKEIADDCLRKIKMDKHESIAFVHEDKGHKHLHIVANRIDDEGKIYRNGNELRLIQRAAKEIAQERGLVSARDIMLHNKELREQGIEPRSIGSMQKLRDEMRSVADQHTEHNTLDKDKYLQGLEAGGYKIKRYYKEGELRGYSVEKDGSFYPAYKIGKEYSLKALAHGIQPAQIKAEQPKPVLLPNEPTLQVKRYDITADQQTTVQVPTRIQQEFKQAIDSIQYNNPLQLKTSLEAQGIAVNLNEARGRYSMTKEGHTLHASEVGRKYTLGNLEKNKGKEQGQRSAQKLAATQEINKQITPDQSISVRRFENNQSIIVQVPTRIQEEFKQALDSIPYNNPLQLKTSLEAQGIAVNMDEVKGRYSMTKEGHTLNASEVGKQYSLANLEKNKHSNEPPSMETQDNKKAQEKKHATEQVQKAALKSEGAKEEMITIKRFKDYKDEVVEVPKRIQDEFKQALDSIPYNTPKQLKAALEAQGIAVNMDEVKGRYSMTREGHTLNASEVGKQYTLTNLEKDKRQNNKPEVVKESKQEIKPAADVKAQESKKEKKIDNGLSM